MNDLLYHLLNSGIDSAPVFADQGIFSIYDSGCKTLQRLIGLLGELYKQVFREIDAKSFYFQGTVVHFNIKSICVHDIVVPANEVERLVKLFVMKAVIAFQSKMEPYHIIFAMA